MKVDASTTPSSKDKTHRLMTAPICRRRRILIEEFEGMAAAAQVQAGTLAGGLAAVPNKHAIDENLLDARGEDCGIRVCRAVDYRVRVEDDEIGERAFTNHAAVRPAETLGR